MDKVGIWAIAVAFLTAGAIMVTTPDATPIGFGLGIFLVVVGVGTYIATCFIPSKFDVFKKYLSRQYELARSYESNGLATEDFFDQWTDNLKKAFETALHDRYLADLKAWIEAEKGMMLTGERRPQEAFTDGYYHIGELFKVLNAGSLKSDVDISYLKELGEAGFIDYSQRYTLGIDPGT